MWCNSSGSGTTKSHIVTDLAVTTVNDLTDTISQPTNSPVDVEFWPHADYDSLVTATPVNGNWDAILPYDIAPGDFHALQVQ